MSEISQNTTSGIISDTPCLRAMMFGDELERMRYLLSSIGVPLQYVDQYTDHKAAKVALKSGKYGAILLDTTRTVPEIIDIHHLSMVGSVATITLSLTRHVMSTYMVQQWEIARNGYFQHMTDQHDRFSGAFICLISAPSAISWINMVKGEVMRVIHELRDKKSDVIFIQGDAGSGKYSIAQYSHAESERKDKKFSFVNCNLKEDGHVDWFSDMFCRNFARTLREIFTETEGGTVYFHDIDHLDFEAQRILAEVLKAVFKPKRCNMKDRYQFKGKVICASSANLQQLVAEGHFAKELYDVVSKTTFHLPSLKKFEDNVKFIAVELLHIICHQKQLSYMEFSNDALKKITDHNWDGNIRDLYTVIQHSVNAAESTTIKAYDIRLTPAVDKGDSKHDIIKNVMRALRESKGNVAAAARLMGKKRNAFIRLMTKYNIPNPFRNNYRKDRHIDEETPATE